LETVFKGSFVVPLLFPLYTKPISSVIHSYKLDHHLYADPTQVYISLYTTDAYLSITQLGGCLSDLSGWMTKIDLGSMRTKHISLLLVHPDNVVRLSVLTLRRPLIIASYHYYTLYVILALQLIAILISENLFIWHHIRDLRRIRRNIYLSVAKTIPTAPITSRLDNCNFPLNTIASKDILKLQYVQNC